MLHRKYILGGVKIYIPYYTKAGEHKFNIVQTGKKTKKLDDKELFIKLVKEIVYNLDYLSMKYESPTQDKKNV